MSGRLVAAVERAWDADDVAARLVRGLLAPAAWAYRAGVAARNAAYDRGLLAVARVPALVVSVGNLAVGGTGKTPAALWLAERLAARGRRVAIVARGYRKRRPGVVVVGTGAGPLVTPDEGGDEAVMLARRFAGPVVTAERRAAAAAHACRAFGCDTVVLDDGFQHRALHRDADLVLLADDARRLRLLPAGPLREPAAALCRARAVLRVGAPGGTPSSAGPGTPPAFRGRLVPQALVRAEAGLWSVEGLGALAGAPVVAVAGVARPERFLATLAGCGARVVRRLVFPDHHRYGAEDVAAVARALREGGAALAVTTEKDLVKLERTEAPAALRALRVGLEVEDGDALVTLLLGAAGSRPQVASRGL